MSPAPPQREQQRASDRHRAVQPLHLLGKRAPALPSLQQGNERQVAGDGVDLMVRAIPGLRMTDCKCAQGNETKSPSDSLRLLICRLRAAPDHQRRGHDRADHVPADVRVDLPLRPAPAVPAFRQMLPLLPQPRAPGEQRAQTSQRGRRLGRDVQHRRRAAFATTPAVRVRLPKAEGWQEVTHLAKKMSTRSSSRFAMP